MVPPGSPSRADWESARADFPRIVHPNLGYGSQSMAKWTWLSYSDVLARGTCVEYHATSSYGVAHPALAPIAALPHMRSLAPTDLDPVDGGA